MDIKLLTTLPFFSGFYNSFHDDDIDHAIEMAYQDDEGELKEAEYEKALDLINYRDIYNDYSKCFVDGVNSELGLNLEFESLESPQFYNFSTDIIYCNITLAELRKVFDLIDRKELEQYLLDQFSNRSGFISFYSNDIRDWLDKDLADYDHNEVGAILEVYWQSQKSEESEYYLVESAYEIVDSHLPALD